MNRYNYYPPSLINQRFGLCLYPDDLLLPFYSTHGYKNYHRQWKSCIPKTLTEHGSAVQDEEEIFKIMLDVQLFKHNEISVKVGNNQVIIEGKHDEREDNDGFISRQFQRRYLLPKGCNPDTVVTSLSSDGVLIVTANKDKVRKSKEIIVPIKRYESYPKNQEVFKPKPEITQNTEEEIKRRDIENEKKKTAVMLKEDHCCLLKPALLGEAAPAVTEMSSIQTKKDFDELFKLSIDTSAQASSSKSSEIIEECQSSAMKEVSELAMASLKAGLTEKVAEASTVAQSKMSSSKNILSETAKSKLSKTIEVQESSSSYSSVTSSIKETSEKISEIVSDISAQLREAAENI